MAFRGSEKAESFEGAVVESTGDAVAVAGVGQL
jgi:hypothetical protein